MSTITEIEEYFSCALPRAYRDFLLSHSEELDEDVHLYLPEDVIERNECYETKKFAPGYINIGDDGAGMAFILQLSDADPEVSVIGHGSMDPAQKNLVFGSFNKWVASGFMYDED